MLSNMTLKKLLKAILKSFKNYLHFISFIYHNYNGVSKIHFCPIFETYEEGAYPISIYFPGRMVHQNK